MSIGLRTYALCMCCIISSCRSNVKPNSQLSGALFTETGVNVLIVTTKQGLPKVCTTPNQTPSSGYNILPFAGIFEKLRKEVQEILQQQSYFSDFTEKGFCGEVFYMDGTEIDDFTGLTAVDVRNIERDTFIQNLIEFGLTPEFMGIVSGIGIFAIPKLNRVLNRIPPFVRINAWDELADSRKIRILKQMLRSAKYGDDLGTSYKAVGLMIDDIVTNGSKGLPKLMQEYPLIVDFINNNKRGIAHLNFLVKKYGALGELEFLQRMLKKYPTIIYSGARGLRISKDVQRVTFGFRPLFRNTQNLIVSSVAAHLTTTGADRIWRRIRVNSQAEQELLEGGQQFAQLVLDGRISGPNSSDEQKAADAVDLIQDVFSSRKFVFPNEKGITFNHIVGTILAAWDNVLYNHKIAQELGIKYEKTFINEIIQTGFAIQDQIIQLQLTPQEAPSLPQGGDNQLQLPGGN